MLATFFGSKKAEYQVTVEAADVERIDSSDDELAGAALTTSPKLTGKRRSTGANLRRARTELDRSTSTLGTTGSAVVKAHLTQQLQQRRASITMFIGDEVETPTVASERRRSSIAHSGHETPSAGKPRRRSMESMKGDSPTKSNVKSPTDAVDFGMPPPRRRSSTAEESPRQSGGNQLLMPHVPPPLRRSSQCVEQSPRPGELQMPHVPPPLRRSSCVDDDDDLETGSVDGSKPPPQTRSNVRSHTDEMALTRRAEEPMQKLAQRHARRCSTEEYVERPFDAQSTAANLWGGRGMRRDNHFAGSAALLGVKKPDVGAEMRAAMEARTQRTKEIQDRFKETKMKDVLTEVCRELQEKKLSQKELFQRLDVSGDGQLSRAEFAYGLKKLGVTLQKEELEAFVKCFDFDGNGSVDFEEFSRLLSRHAANCAGELANLDEQNRVCGFKIGSMVKIAVKLGGVQEKEEGTVLGPGTQPGTVMVRFAKCQQTLSLKPIQIRCQKAG